MTVLCMPGILSNLDSLVLPTPTYVKSVQFFLFFFFFFCLVGMFLSSLTVVVRSIISIRKLYFTLGMFRKKSPDLKEPRSQV